MKILIISRNMGALQSPVISVRIIEYLEYLKDEGYLEYAAISENDSTAIQMLSWADCIVFNKHFSDNAYCIALLAKEKKIKIIYDIDDQIFAWPESHKSLYIRDQKSFLRFIEIADVLTVENIRIYNELKLLKRDMVVIPNGIYTEKYKQPDLSARKK